MIQSPLTLANSLVTGSVSLAANSVATSARMAVKSEELLEETILTIRAARPVIEALGEAIEAGLLEDAKALIETVSATQEDVRGARESMERLVSLVNATLDGVGGVPGAQIILKGIARVAGGTKASIPVSVVTETETEHEPESRNPLSRVPNPVTAGTAAAKAAVKVASAATPKPKSKTSAKKQPAKK